uniref:Peptidase S1 domain-containing protein n=1 Tax=Anopheles minimus TaxID=112268 RepID=A0A182W3M0_9DIPT
MEVSNLARNIITLRFNMMLGAMPFMLMVVLGLMAGVASGKLQAQGKYEMLATPNKNTDERSIVDNMKMLFGTGSNRAPAHDTPASACSCRCGERNDASRIVTFGEHNRCDDSVRPETRFVLRAIAQKFSFLNFDNDIALLRLNDRVPITDFIRPICLPSDPSNAYVGTNGTATGWGTLKEDGKPSCVLQEVEVPVLSNEVCTDTVKLTVAGILKR